jgi:hypothetical protein
MIPPTEYKHYVIKHWKNMETPLTDDEIRSLAADYINLEGYDDSRWILSVMSQEYPGLFDRKKAMKLISETVREYIHKPNLP